MCKMIIASLRGYVFGSLGSAAFVCVDESSKESNTWTGNWNDIWWSQLFFRLESLIRIFTAVKTTSFAYLREYCVIMSNPTRRNKNPFSSPWAQIVASTIIIIIKNSFYRLFFMSFQHSNSLHPQMVSHSLDVALLAWNYAQRNSHNSWIIPNDKTHKTIQFIQAKSLTFVSQRTIHASTRSFDSAPFNFSPSAHAAISCIR